MLKANDISEIFCIEKSKNTADVFEIIKNQSGKVGTLSFKKKNKESKGICLEEISKGKKKIFVIKANEAFQIAKETLSLYK